MPTLHDLCLRVLQEHVDSIEECGGLPFSVLEPVLSRALPASLARIEEYNPYLLQDTAELWEKHCKRHFPRAEREEMETWREMFERCTEEREKKLSHLKSKITSSYAKEKEAHKKTKVRRKTTLDSLRIFLCCGFLFPKKRKHICVTKYLNSN